MKKDALKPLKLFKTIILKSNDLGSSFGCSKKLILKL